MVKNEFMEHYMEHPIYIATKWFQRRKHHKKRINKSAVVTLMGVGYPTSQL